MITIELKNNDIIKQAKYGYKPKYIDVLKIINSYINKKKFKVSNETFKKDPYHKICKHLILNLESGKKIVILEGETILIKTVNTTLENIEEFKLIKKNQEYTNYSHDIVKNYKKQTDILCLSTFNNKLYNYYGKDFLDTYNFPFDLILYSEDDMDIIKKKHSFKNNLEFINIINADDKFKQFIDRNKKRNIDDSKRGFRYNTIRFSYKIFAVAHAVLNFDNYKYVIWLDGDMLFKKPLTQEIIESMFTKDNNMLSYMGRKRNYHSECGFLIFNLKHNYTQHFLYSIRELYLLDKIYDEKEWHDSYIWDRVRILFEQKYNIKNFNITTECSTGKMIHNHPLLSTHLYQYIDHLKGDIRKELKTSDPKKFNEYVKNNKK